LVGVTDFNGLVEGGIVRVHMLYYFLAARASEMRMIWLRLGILLKYETSSAQLQK